MAKKLEHVHCSKCGKRCSGVDPELGLVVRAWVECPECLENAGERPIPQRLARKPITGPASQLIALERELRESLRGGYLFRNFDEPLDAAGLRVVRVIQQRLSDLPCECTDRTPDGARCRACGGMLP